MGHGCTFSHSSSAQAAGLERFPVTHVIAEQFTKWKQKNLKYWLALLLTVLLLLPRNPDPHIGFLDFFTPSRLKTHPFWVLSTTQ
jgi:hypothetical protein